MLSFIRNTDPDQHQLFWLSFILLFAEIMALRWMGVEFPTVRVFPNLVVVIVLIATSGGLISSNNKLFNSLVKNKSFFLFCVFFLLGVAICAPQLSIGKQSIRVDQDTPSLLLNISFLAAIMIALYGVFLKLGNLLAPAFNKLSPLLAYSINLSGSIAGTLAFALISYLGLPPSIWLLILGASIYLIERKTIIVIFTCLLASLSTVLNHTSYWSPYSKLDLIPVKTVIDSATRQTNYTLNSNNCYFHSAFHVVPSEIVNATQDAATQVGPDKIIRDLYKWLEIPFYCTENPRSVLILGAGSGNDVSYALARGVQHIDAVEIDPIICRLGKTRHPDLPYLNNKVSLYNEDARTFLRYSKKKYDLIEFAYLDPGATLRSASFLCVDNYVYTVESIRSALVRLNPDGVITLAFATGPNSPITQKLFKAIKAANGDPPIALVDRFSDSVVFIFGPRAKNTPIKKIITSNPAMQIWQPAPEIQQATNLVTDQWPFLYTDFNSNGIWLYVSVLLVLVALPSLLLFFAQQGNATFAEIANMFFLGLAFMLIETKSIVELSLLFGATWLVSSIVILIVLSLAWLSNLYIIKKKSISLPFIYTALFLIVLLDYFFYVPAQTTWSPIVISLTASLLTCLPIFFSSMIFSSSFAKAKSPSTYLAANLLGVAFGGLTENLSLLIGLKALSFVALGIYVLSALCLFVIYKKTSSS